jgi:Putative rhamnosyl transferase
MLEGPAIHPRAWLQRRLDLFLRFCLPSVAAQTREDFVWLVFCDELTDAEILAELRAAERRLPAMRVAVTDLFHDPHHHVCSLLDPGTEVLITTRVDSDDAIADRYLEAVREYAVPFHRSAHPDLLLNFPRGYRRDEGAGRLYEARMHASPFHSLFERPGRGPVATAIQPLNTALYDQHATLHRQRFTHQDDSMHGWIQVLHGGNVANQIERTDYPARCGWPPPGFSPG